MYSSRPPKGPQQQAAYGGKMGSQSGGGAVGGGGGAGGPGGQPPGMGAAAINTIELCERIKEEYQFLTAQNQQLKMELEKLAQDKTEMQRHYVMVSVSSLVFKLKGKGLNFKSL